MRNVVGDIQCLLAAELIEWHHLAVEAKFKICPALEVQAKSEQTPITDYHDEDGEGDLLMTDYEVNLRSRNYVLRLRTTDLRPVRSPS